ncbi:MAG: hypothetical protein QM774_02765 [Gordonia sp. (in: high G+C Gram-positive bacteria)]|uniref:hypothetical protein n=1 Tax=Gordonia sp. (in: high G+C Gram-positive bacteria) TaxID=84139 RepID=UPI0039E604B8
MNRPVNERQREVLLWIADGCPEGKWSKDDNGYKLSAAALKARGLANVTGHGKSWTAAITDAGAHYLAHGNYPPSAAPATPRVAADRSHRARPAKLDLGTGASETLAEAKALIKQLQDHGTLTIRDPDESVRARYRRMLHACRIHHLVPTTSELRFTGRSSGDIVVMLGTDSPTDSASWDRIRTRARAVTTNLDALRSALETTSILNEVTQTLHPRAIAIILDLAEELRAEELRLGVNTKLKTPRLFIQVDSRRRNLRLTEILDEIPHIPSDAEKRELRRVPWKQLPKFDSVPSGRLSLEIERDGSQLVQLDRHSSSYVRNSDSWSDEKMRPLESRVHDIALAIKKGVVDDTDAREREEERRAKAREEYERKQAAEQQAWEELRERARGKALRAQRETIFMAAFERWQEARELRQFAEQLEVEAITKGVLDNRPRLREWMEWAHTLADEIDPVVNLNHLDDGVFDAEPSDDDLRPYMQGWDPSAPHKDYSLSQSARQSPAQHAPQSRPWHPGMRNRPAWWRH